MNFAPQRRIHNSQSTKMRATPSQSPLPDQPPNREAAGSTIIRKLRLPNSGLTLDSEWWTLGSCGDPIDESSDCNLKADSLKSIQSNTAIPVLKETHHAAAPASTELFGQSVSRTGLPSGSAAKFELLFDNGCAIGVTLLRRPLQWELRLHTPVPTMFELLCESREDIQDAAEIAFSTNLTIEIGQT